MARPTKTKLILPIVLALLAVPPLAERSSALEAAVIAGLRTLDPGTRLEQRCDIEAMTRLDKDKTGYRPDRVVAAATAGTVVDGNTIRSEGGAFRSKGKWYGLTFVCATSDDHMEVSSFEYEIGEAIPEERWEEYGLFD